MEDNAVYIYRLRRLAEFLEDVEDRTLNMNFWKPDWDGTEEDAPRCGFVACALGWAGSMPEFQAEGLQMRRYKDDDEYYPEYDGQRGAYAGAAFFGLPMYIAAPLFDAPYHALRFGFTRREDVKGRHVAVSLRELADQMELGQEPELVHANAK